MAHFALLWKARTVEKYRLNYENEKNNSIITAGVDLPNKTLFQRWSHYRYDAQKRLSRTFYKWYPKGSHTSNFFSHLKTDQIYINFFLKTMLGFLVGLILTYLCFLFFVFQLSISLYHATIMSSVIGVLLTLGLAFSYRIRCLVFLLVPQFFSRVGRYTLTCYTLVLILTGPATNTLKNSEVLSESMACSQEHIKSSVFELNELIRNPYNSVKDSMKLIMDNMKKISTQMIKTVVKINRLVLSIVSVIKSTFSWLQSIAYDCHHKLGTPYQHCIRGLVTGVKNCRHIYGYNFTWLCNLGYVADSACDAVKPFSTFCGIVEDVDDSILATVKRRLINFSDRIRTMLYVEVHVHRSYNFFSNTSVGNQLAAGIVTEIRNKADPIFTWLSWSSCITSLSLLLIIFRAKHYQHMYETRSRFDNRYVTKELRELDLKRQREGRETILPLNRRERAKYITTTSFRLLASEKVYLNRSAVFMIITTFKLLIHMVADYSLYWVLMTIRYHGRSQTPLQAEIIENDMPKSDTSFVARFIRSIIKILNIPLSYSMPSSISCLPNPYPPDFRRYTQIGVLIFLLWFFALLEPYGLRLRNVIMGHYRPERSKARAVWLYNHILRTRGSFMKFARRKLHKEYKYSSESKFTFRKWLDALTPFHCLRSLLGTAPDESHCLLCGTIEFPSTIDTELTSCKSKGCPGIYCYRCFSDIGQLCTICLSPTDYGDLSDVSLEEGSNDENSHSEDDFDEYPESNDKSYVSNFAAYNEELESDNDSKYPRQRNNKRNWGLFRTRETDRENIPLLPYRNKSNKGFTIINAQTVCKNNSMQLVYQNIFFNSTYFENNDPDFYLYLKYNDIRYTKHYIDTDIDKSNNSLSKIRIFYHPGELIKINGYLEKRNKNTNFMIYNTLTWTYNKDSTDRLLQSYFDCSIMIYPVTYLLQSNFYDIKKVRCSLSITKLHQQTELAKVLRRSYKKIIRCKKKFRENERNFNMKKNVKSNMPRRQCSNGYLRNSIRSFCGKKKEFNKKIIQKSLDGDKIMKKKSNNQKAGKIDGSKNKRRKFKLVDVNEDDDLGNDHGNFLTKCSKYWNNIKFNPIPCVDLFKCDQKEIQSKQKKNYKHRKKRNGSDFNEDVPVEAETKKDIEEARRFRISSYFADQEWFKRKYDTKVCTNKKNNLTSSRNVSKSNSMFKLNTRSISFRWDIPKTEGYLLNQRSCHCLDMGKISPDIPIKPTSEKNKLSIKVLERFRKKNRREPCSSFPSEFIDNIVSAVDVHRDEALKHACSNTNKSISRRMKYCRSLGINEFDEVTIKDKGALYNPTICLKKILKKSRYDNNNIPMAKMKKRCKVSGISDSSVSSQTNESICKKSIIDNGYNRKKWMYMKRAMSEKIVDIRLKNRLSSMKRFCSSIFGSSTNDKGSYKADIKEIKKTKNTASVGVNVLPTMKSFSCQHIETKLLRDHTTQIGTYVIETEETGTEKYTREAAVDTTHHTCTCATQRVVTNRDVGTWLDQQYCGLHMNYHNLYDEPDQFKPKIHQNVSRETSNSADKISTSNNLEYKENNKGKNIDISSSLLDSLSFTSVSSIISDGTKTDTTIYSLATVDYKERRKSRNVKDKVKVVTKANQSTLTDRTKLCDVSTVTNDWWSPLIERKDKEISLEKKQGGYTMQNEKIRKRNRGMTTDGKIVSFRSQAQIIPTGTVDIMSPARYLLESQKYYNELFSSKFYAPRVFPITAVQKHQESNKNRSPMSNRNRTRRGHKTKRLEEGYSPRRQKQTDYFR